MFSSTSEFLYRDIAGDLLKKNRSLDGEALDWEGGTRDDDEVTDTDADGLSTGLRASTH